MWKYTHECDKKEYINDVDDDDDGRTGVRELKERKQGERVRENLAAENKRE